LWVKILDQDLPGMICGVLADEGKDVDIAVPLDGANRRFSDGAGGVFARLFIKREKSLCEKGNKYNLEVSKPAVNYSLVIHTLVVLHDGPPKRSLETGTKCGFM